MEKKKKSVQKAYNKLIRRLRAQDSRAVHFAEQSALERGYKVPKDDFASIITSYPKPKKKPPGLTQAEWDRFNK